MVAEQCISILPGVPSLFSALLHMLCRSPRALPSLRAITNTGEHLPEASVKRLLELLPGVDIFLMYGLTECKRVAIMLPAELADHPGSVGRALDGTSAEVRTPDGTSAAHGVPGELVVRGPHVTMGYWRAPEETARKFLLAPDGSRALLTGDICRRSADGFIYFERRDDAQAKRRGFRISLLEIESAALAVSGTVGAAAIMAPNTDELHLFVVGTEAGPGCSDRPFSDAIIRELRGQLEPHKIPDRIHVIASLPTTANGKTDYQRLRLIVAEEGPGL
jgi:acyl-CoA synthetase (AMP-forming)/AMP-acid ligase II